MRTAADGFTWSSTRWADGRARTFTAAQGDPDDPWLDTNHGDATFTIDGKGGCRAAGDHVRLYVRDPLRAREWGENVEVTAWVTRVGETRAVSYSGFQCFVRTNHGTLGSEDTNRCDDRGYGGKVNVDGTWGFEKETAHHRARGYADPGGVHAGFWDAAGVRTAAMPVGVPFGFKMTVRTARTGGAVTVCLWRARPGADGGKPDDWERVFLFTDDGTNLPPADPCRPDVDAGLPLTRDRVLPASETRRPFLACYLRHEYGTMTYARVSIREVEPLP